MSAHALGVDIGGTKVSVTLGDERGKILAREILPKVREAVKRGGMIENASA